MIQFPTFFVNDLVDSGIPFNSVIDAIFTSGVTDEEREEIELTDFILSADLDKFLDADTIYSMEALTVRNQ